MNKKIIASVLAVVFAFSMAGPVGAITDEQYQSLLDQFNQLTLLYNQLLAQISGQTAGVAVCFNTDLQYGMQSNDVKNLQIKLSVSPTSGWFGPITLAAVKTFQTSNGIINTGYVGPLTRGALNALYCTPVVPPTTTTTTVAPSETTTTTTVVAATEGSLTITQNPLPGSATVTVYGGNTDKEVSAYKIKATNSKVTLKRIDLQFGLTSGFPWTDFTTIGLYDGSTLLKEISAVEASFIENTFATTYTLRMDGLNFEVPQDETKVLSVKVTGITSPLYAGTLTVLIPSNGVRGTDTAGLSVYGPSAALTAHTFYTSAAQAPTITVTAATDNPLSGNILGYAASITRVDLLKINVKVENVGMTWKGGTIAVVDGGTAELSAIELYDGSTVLASAASAGTATVTFSTYTLPMSAGTTKTLTVKGVVRSNPDAADTFSASLPATTGLTGVDSNGSARNNGTAGAITGNTMYVYQIGPAFAYVSSSATVKGSNSQTNPSDIGDTAITFSVTANGGDIYVATKATTATALQETLTGWVATTTTSTTWTCVSPGENTTNSSYWRVPSGQTANCTYSTLVTNTGGTAGYYSVELDTVTWATTATTTGATAQTWGLTNIKTANFYLGI